MAISIFLFLSKEGQLVQGQLVQLLDDALRILRNSPTPIVVLDHSLDALCPPEAKKRAEAIARMARDLNMHFAVTTCNPYVLLSLIEKTPSSQLTVLVAQIEGDAKELRRLTEVRRLTKTQIEEILDLEVDVFFNIDKLFEEALPIDF